MANKIEIVITGRNDLPKALADAKGQAEAFGKSAGESAGEKFSDSLGEKVRQELPPKLEDPMKETGVSSGAAFSRSFTDRASQDLGSSGVFGDMLAHAGAPEGEKFAASFNHSVQDALVRSTVATAAGADFGEEYVQRVRSRVPPALGPDGEVGAPIVDESRKTGDKAGKEAGKAAGNGMSPLIIGAIAGAAAIGAPALLAGLGTAFVGIAALALKSNKVISADYAQLAKNAETAFQQAAAPIAGTMHDAVTRLEGDVRNLQPELTGLFANMAPDITAVADGLNSFVSSALPGLSSALGNSQVIVSDFAQSLGPLGSGVGSFFTGLTRDAALTGAGLQAVVGVIGNAVSTLGSVIGSAAAGISGDLLAIAPAINGLLTGVRAISSPATVSGLAGAFAAFKFGDQVAGGLTSASKALGGFAKDAETTSGLMGKIKGAAGGLGGALSSAAGVVSGPWGIAIGAGIGLLGAFGAAIWESSHAADALLLSAQGLGDAVAQDQGQIGSATAAYVAQQAVADGLAKSAADAGVSVATWTQAVIGNKAAQQEVTAAVEVYNQDLDNQRVVTDMAAKSTGKFSDEQKDAQTAADGAAAASNRLTDKNKQLLASMAAQNKQITDAITKQAQLQAAQNALNNSTTIFNATLDAAYQKLVSSAQASSMNSIAAINLGDANATLNQSLYNSVDAYTQAQQGGNGYLAVLDSLSGTENALLGTEAAYTTSLSNLTKVTKGHTDSLDKNTAAGAANITKVTQIVTAADKAAQAIFNSEVNTKGSTVAYNDANAALQTMKQRFIDAADKAGFDKTQVQALADQLFKLPQNVQVGVDTGPARSGLLQLLKRIDSSSGTVTVYENSSGRVFSSGGGNKADAHGGIVGAASGGVRSNLTMVGEQGRELVSLPVGSTVHSNPDTERMLGGVGGAGGVLQVEWVGGNGGDPLMQWIRSNIRFRYGSDPDSVQKALGSLN